MINEIRKANSPIRNELYPGIDKIKFFTARRILAELAVAGIIRAKPIVKDGIQHVLSIFGAHVV